METPTLKVIHGQQKVYETAFKMLEDYFLTCVLKTDANGQRVNSTVQMLVERQFVFEKVKALFVQETNGIPFCISWFEALLVNHFAQHIKAEKRSEHTKKYIYVFQTTDKTKVKIGFSYDPIKRLSQLRGNSESLEFVCCFAGTRRQEAKLHSLYQHIRVNSTETEFFYFTSEISDLISEATSNPVFDVELFIHAQQSTITN